MQSAHYLSPSEIKKQAKADLRNKWKPVILLYLVPVLISILLSGGIYGFDFWTIVRLANNEGESSVLANFLVTFITIGISYTLLDIVRSSSYKVNPLGDAFQVFSKNFFIPVFIIQILQGLFIALWSLLFVIPGIVQSYAYSQAFFIYKDSKESNYEEYPTALDCITASKELMRGHKLELFFLHLSFFGWYILEALTLGIASFYVRPYLNTAEAVFYNRIVYSEIEYSYSRKNYADEENDGTFAEF